MARTRNRIPSARTFDAALNALPSTNDGPSALYGFRARQTLKVGRACEPPKRKMQWAYQCPGQRQDWLAFWWEVPFYKKFERIIHLELKRLRAWLGRVRCPFCRTLHQEKYDLQRCRGMAGFIRIVEGRLRTLGWAVTRVYF
ncbi:hypothetical protein B0H12DRAFT_1236969 [Mycena haematopus]|nr:hypothetical protein B0H12DRAFT_1236969 [Mycena haematopus]